MAKGNRNRDLQPATPKKEEIVQIVHQQIAEFYSGPLPPAQQLESYEAIVPGMAERVLVMAEKNAEHRQKLESAVVTGNVAAQARGQRFAFVIALIVIGSGCWMISTDRSSVGLTMILSSLTTLAAVFFGVRKSQQSERAERRKELGRPPS